MGASALWHVRPPTPLLAAIRVAMVRGSSLLGILSHNISELPIKPPNLALRSEDGSKTKKNNALSAFTNVTT
jgi:hypothetical protein